MIVSLDDLISQLQKNCSVNDTKPQDALWISFDPRKTKKTVEYRTADDNTLVHVYLDEADFLIGIEIFP